MAGGGGVSGCEDCGFAFHVVREVGCVDAKSDTEGEGREGEGAYEIVYEGNMSACAMR